MKNNNNKLWIPCVIGLLLVVLYCEKKHGFGRKLADYSHKELIPPPIWAQQGVLYQIFPRVFSEEGTFQAVIKKLPYIKSLGVDIIWLMPIFPIGEKGRKGTIGCPYAVRDFREINPDYGTVKDFHELVTGIHQIGMKVIIDFVPNHGSNDNVLMDEHPEWFLRDKQGNFTREETDWSDITDFNYENPELRSYMIETMVYWIQEFNIDGYRCDVAGMLPYDFWRDVNKKLREIKADIFLLAEWEDPEILLTGFNSDYGWTEYYLLIDIRKGKKRTSQVLSVVDDKDSHYPRNALPMRFLENHDEPRSLYKFGVQSIEAYAILLFTLPGIPLIYAGQEMGEIKKPSLFEKSHLNWSMADSEITNLYRSLVDLRKDNSCFSNGRFVHLPTASLAGSPGAFLREDKNSVAFVITNLQKNPAKNVLVNFPAGERKRFLQLTPINYFDDSDTLDLKEIYFKELPPFTTLVYTCQR